MTAEILAGLAGAILSAAFAYAPGLAPWFDKLEAQYKRLIMAALIILVGGVAFGLACADIPEFAGGVTCDRAGIVGLIQAIGTALIVNQSVYPLIKRSESGPYFARPYKLDNMAGNEPDDYNNFPVA